MKFLMVLSVTALIVIFGVPFFVMAAEDERILIEVHFSPPAVQAGAAKYAIGYVNVLNADGKPILAPEDLEITLVSKNPSVASVPSSVTILQNEGYTKFDVTVSNVEGETEISATYEDQQYVQKFRVGGINVEVPLGVDLEILAPTESLRVDTAMPLSVFLKNGDTILQVPKDIKVTLQYDDSLISLENDELIIEKGNYYATTTLKALKKGGSAFIKAVTEIPPLESVANIRLTSSSPSKLQIDVFPEEVIQLKDREIDIFVSLLDENDNPIVATEDVHLQLFSNLNTLDDDLEQEFEDNDAIIKRGEWGFYHRVDNILFQETSDTNFIGALAPGYGLAQQLFEVREELENDDPRAEDQTIKIHQPSNMPPNSTAIVVYQTSALKTVVEGEEDPEEEAEQAEIDAMIAAGTLEEHPFDDDDEFPDGSLYPIMPDFDEFDADEREGKVVSSNTNAVQVIKPGQMSGKSSYGTAIIKSGTISGDATISVAIKGIGTGTDTIEVVNPLSQSKTMIFSPVGDDKIVFNSEGVSDLYVIALDASDQPASSKDGLEYLVEPINELAEVLPQSTFSKIQIKSSSFVKDLETGESTITVSPIGEDVNEDLQKATDFEIAPSSSTVTIFLPFDNVVASNLVHPVGVVQLVDFFGNPVAVTNDLKVEINANTSQITIPSSVTIPAGNSFVEFPITTFGVEGNTGIFATARGLFGSEIGLKQVQFIKTLNIFPVYPDQPLQVNQAAELQIFVDDENAASVNDALLSFTPDQNSTVFPQSISSNDNGEATVLFTPQAGPTASLTIHASKFGYADDETTITFDIAGFEVRETLFGIPPWMLYVAIAGAVGGIAVVVIRLLRKPKQMTEEEAENEEI